MEAFGIIGMVFGFMGVISFIRLEKLEKQLKKTGILDKDYKSFWLFNEIFLSKIVLLLTL